MASKRSGPIVVTYVVSLLAAIALLVSWVIYVVRSSARINELAARVGMSQERFHSLALVAGCALFFLLIVGLTYQLAQALAARRYLAKQDEFLSTVTHELRSPLAAIRLHAETLAQQDEVEPADRRRFVGYILQQTERMGALVENVLESSRLAARTKHLKLQPVPLARFFADYFDEAEPRIEGQGVHLTTEVTTGATVLATVEALHRVMNNLLDNAVRFSRRGGEVRCRVGEAAGQVRIEVEDDGIGIPKKELAKVFDRFYQIGRHLGSRQQGTGLGLSIVSGLVKEMGGTVRAFSQEGRPGTRFVVELPVAGAPA